MTQAAQSDNFDHDLKCLGVSVPVSPYLTESRIERIRTARYEGQEIAGALAVVGPEDRVLELGAGLGIVGAVIARNCRPAEVRSFEANPDLIPHIQALYHANDLTDRITVTNRIMLSQDPRPATVPFFIRNSFLGSSVVENPIRASRQVDVATGDFNHLCQEYRPTVLIIDIEGGELELLRKADLDGIRAVVIEFHEEVYGRDGAQACKQILLEAGFEKRPEHCSRVVWTCERPTEARITVPASDLTVPTIETDTRKQPSPAGGWSETAEICPAAIVVPPDGGAMLQPTGVLRADGSYVDQGALWRRHRPITTQPAWPDGPIFDLPGRWLFAGPLWNHFGHFLTESLPRLWAVEGFGTLDGVVFTPKRAATGDAIEGYHKAMFDALSLDLPVRVVTAPTRVAELVVPGQGFGLGPISAGTPTFRRFIQSRFAQDIPPEGPKKLYISRSQIGPRRGGFLAEARLEQHLADAGYDIFHPQKHDIPTQIARYKAAKRIVAAEGSALHLVAMVAKPKQKIAVIMRRNGKTNDPITTHLASFSGRPPLNVAAIRRRWMPASGGRAHQGVAEIDLESAQQQLLAEGFVKDSAPWRSLTEDEARDTIQAQRYWRVNGYRPE